MLVNGCRRVGIGAFVGLALLGIACTSQDADHLARIGKKTAEKFDAASGGAPNKLAISWQAVRANLDLVTLDSRVSARLRWDKELSATKIQVHAATGNSVVLKGSVPTNEQRQRAVQLANATTGVEQVKDELEVKQ